MSDRMQVIVGLAIVLFLVLPIALLFTPWWIAGVGILVFDLVAPIVVFLFSLKKLDQNTGMIPAFLGATRRPIINKTDHTVEDNGDIVSGEDFRLGGLRLFGLPGLYTPWEKKFSWGKFENGKVVTDTRERVSRFKLTQYQYGFHLEEIECKTGIRMTADLFVVGQSINLIKQWVDNEDWFAEAFALFLEDVKKLFKGFDPMDLLYGDYDLGKMLEERIGTATKSKSLAEIEKDLGVRFRDFIIANMDAPPEVRDSIDARFVAQQKSKQIEILLGSLIKSIVEFSGEPLAEVQKQYRDDPNAWAKKHRMILEPALVGIEQALGQETIRVRTSGSGGGGLAALGALTGRKGSSGGSGKRRRRDDDYLPEDGT